MKCAPVSKRERRRARWLSASPPTESPRLVHHDVEAVAESSRVATSPAIPPPTTTTGALAISGSAVLNAGRGAQHRAEERGPPGQLVQPVERSEGGERDRRLERQPVDDWPGRGPVIDALRSEYTQLTGLTIVSSSSTAKPVCVGEPAQGTARRRGTSAAGSGSRPSADASRS